MQLHGYTFMEAKFHPGSIAATTGFMKQCKPKYAMAALGKHLQGDWGVVCPEDKQMNDDALKHGGRLLSAYPLPDDPDVFWIITEADRSVTTFLLPSEY